MGDKGVNGGGKVLGTVAAFAAAFAARKIIALGWKQVTGKEPPTDPHDTKVGMLEALAWSVVLGVGVETARLVAIRTAAKKMRQVSPAED